MSAEQSPQQWRAAAVRACVRVCACVVAVSSSGAAPTTTQPPLALNPRTACSGKQSTPASVTGKHKTDSSTLYNVLAECRAVRTLQSAYAMMQLQPCMPCCSACLAIAAHHSALAKHSNRLHEALLCAKSLLAAQTKTKAEQEVMAYADKIASAGHVEVCACTGSRCRRL